MATDHPKIRAVVAKVVQEFGLGLYECRLDSNTYPEPCVQR